MISDYFESFHKMNRTSHNGSLSGTYFTYAEGEQFNAGCSTNAQTAAEIASQQGAKVTYTLFLPFDAVLGIGDMVKRDKSGLLLTVTSNPLDMEIPGVSSMKYRVCTAEVAER